MLRLEDDSREPTISTGPGRLRVGIPAPTLVSGWASARSSSTAGHSRCRPAPPRIDPRSSQTCLMPW